jgi:hypothetical protein
MVKAIFYPVTDGAVFKQTGETASYRVDQSGFTGNIEVSLMLAGEAGGW